MSYYNFEQGDDEILPDDFCEEEVDICHGSEDEDLESKEVVFYGSDNEEIKKEKPKDCSSSEKETDSDSDSSGMFSVLSNITNSTTATSCTNKSLKRKRRKKKKSTIRMDKLKRKQKRFKIKKESENHAVKVSRKKKKKEEVLKNKLEEAEKKGLSTKEQEEFETLKNESKKREMLAIEKAKKIIKWERQKKEFEAPRKIKLSSMQPLGYKPNLDVSMETNSINLKKKPLEKIQIVGNEEAKKKEFSTSLDILYKTTCFIPFSKVVTSRETTQKFYSEITKNRCFWCSNNCDCIPLPCALKFHQYNMVFEVYGSFCTLNCLMAYALKIGKGPVNRLMLNKVYNIPISKAIKRALNPYLQQSFGGHLTRDAYMDKSRDTKISHFVFELPLIPYQGGLEEVIYTKLKIGDNEVIQGDNQMALNLTINKDNTVGVKDAFKNSVNRLSLNKQQEIESNSCSIPQIIKNTKQNPNGLILTRDKTKDPERKKIEKFFV